MPLTIRPLSSVAHPAIRALSRTCDLTPSAADALHELTGSIERYPAASVISSSTSQPQVKWLLSGWTIEVRVLRDGRRQICSCAIPGDPVLSRPVNAPNPCTLVALTRVECIDVAQTLAWADEANRHEIWRAMNRALSLAEERRYEHIIRLARRTALQRLADFLLELHDRLEQVDTVGDRGFHLPLTQQDLADALGLSPVHVNRSLKKLRLKGIATLNRGRVTNFHRQRSIDLIRPEGE